MRFDTKIDALEEKGVIYHRDVANFLSERIDNFNKTLKYEASTLVIGETDLFISKTIAKKHKLHILTKKRGDTNSDIRPIFEDIHRESRIIPVTKESFRFDEYDLIIFALADLNIFKEVIEKYPSIKFIFIPNYLEGYVHSPEVSKDIKSFLSTHGICFTIEKLTCNYLANNLTYSNL